MFSPLTGNLEPEQPQAAVHSDHELDDDAFEADLHNQFGADGAFDDILPNYGAAFVWPVAVHADDDLGTEEWLLQMYKAAVQAEAVRPLEVLDSGAVLLLAPLCDATPGQRAMGAMAARVGAQQVARVNPFTIMAVQQLMCSDGTMFFDTCQNACCARSPQDHQFFHDLMQHPNAVHRTLDDVLGDRVPLCDCAAAAIEALWGSVGHDVDIVDEDSFGSWFTAQEPGANRRKLLHCTAMLSAVLTYGDIDLVSSECSVVAVR